MKTFLIRVLICTISFILSRLIALYFGFGVCDGDMILTYLDNGNVDVKVKSDMEFEKIEKRRFVVWRIKKIKK